MARGRQYSAEFKREAVALVTPARRWQEVADELGVPQGTFWRWYREDQAQPAGGLVAEEPNAVAPAAYQAALQRIAELERENEFLGKASAYFARKPQP